MTYDRAADERPPVPMGAPDKTEEALGDAFSAAFDGEPTANMDPYVRLVPPAGDGAPSGVHAPDGVTRGPSGTPMFDPHEVERREYRLLARALTNEDDVTDHRAAMALVQLVKFLRAAGINVPRFPDTPETPDPGAVL